MTTVTVIPSCVSWTTGSRNTRFLPPTSFFSPGVSNITEQVLSRCSDAVRKIEREKESGMMYRTLTSFLKIFLKFFFLIGT